MKMMSGRITSCCVVLLLAFTSVSAVRQVLDSISDLTTGRFGQSVPMESRELLRWFATQVNIDINGVIRLTFDLNSGDYGTHHYGNFEGLLDPLPWGYRYYTLGNTNQQTSFQLPSHGRNRARIIIRVMVQNTGGQASRIIDRVYLTQHYQIFEYQRSEYDPEQTYQVTTNLLREIRGFPMERYDNLPIYPGYNFGRSANTSQLWNIRNTWGDQHSTHQGATRRNEQHDFWTNDQDCVPERLFCLGFLFFLVVVILCHFFY